MLKITEINDIESNKNNKSTMSSVGVSIQYYTGGSS